MEKYIHFKLIIKIYQIIDCEIKKLSVRLERPIDYYAGIVSTPEGGNNFDHHSKQRFRLINDIPYV